MRKTALLQKSSKVAISVLITWYVVMLLQLFHV